MNEVVHGLKTHHWSRVEDYSNDLNLGQSNPLCIRSCDKQIDWLNFPSMTHLVIWTL